MLQGQHRAGGCPKRRILPSIVFTMPYNLFILFARAVRIGLLATHLVSSSFILLLSLASQAPNNISSWARGNKPASRTLWARSFVLSNISRLTLSASSTLLTRTPARNLVRRCRSFSRSDTAPSAPFVNASTCWNSSFYQNNSLHEESSWNKESSSAQIIHPSRNPVPQYEAESRNQSPNMNNPQGIQYPSTNYPQRIHLPNMNHPQATWYLLYEALSKNQFPQYKTFSKNQFSPYETGRLGGTFLDSEELNTVLVSFNTAPNISRLFYNT